jgi:hypothetical protein
MILVYNTLKVFEEEAIIVLVHEFLVETVLHVHADCLVVSCKQLL